MTNNLPGVLKDIKMHLSRIFNDVDIWFDKDAGLRSYRPMNNGWNINQVLEHIGLTNHFLLILIAKGTKKALNNVNQIDLKEALANYTFQKDKLTEIGLHQSFTWVRPEHMEPRGEKTLDEVRKQLKDQVRQCYDCLDILKNGEGVLCKTTMTVNGIGKIDVYEYVYFLSQHGQRHLTQMEKIEKEYLEKKLADSFN